ncbi:hypothetical protein NF556_08030 [Ornithinimicrobium faecis]|uniref:ABC-2 type transport system permease protein n=1 Tax=Ornithinimicrobium faecis TaxID=2934158 RepID=A0ABY4YZN1_9MICO|nr:hypothetical protein [Ornithinimicrobium sp. HY1793]USQ81582.1 hypothetical protein NF556_08030 [Ornithinimicrobium sp. HY1793]
MSHQTEGTARIIRLSLRTGWPGLLAVAALAAGLVTTVAGSIAALYPDLTDRQLYAETLGVSPATQAFNGLGHGLHTLGGITAYEIGFMGQLLFPLLALHVAVRHTRGEEEAGRTELLTATRLGRLAPLAAGAVLLLGTCLLTGALMLPGMVVAGLGAGSIWYVAGVVLLMLFFGATGLLLGQLAQSTRTAHLIGLGLTTGAFLTRAVIDGRGWDAAWASPLGWAAAIAPFAQPRAWPLVAFALGSLLLLAAATWVALRRDLGAGVIAPHPGPARARPARVQPALGTVLGVAWRLTRPTALAWGVIAVLWAGSFGLLTEEMASLVDDNPTVLAALGVERGADVVTGMAVVVIVLAATAAAVQGSSQLGTEEGAGRLSALLATRRSRTGVWLGWWAVVAASSLIVLTVGVLALGLTSWATTGDRDTLGTALGVGWGYAVPVLFVAAIASALRAALPPLAGLAWLLVGWIVLVGFLAETLRLPAWSRDLSPVHLVGTLPQDDLSGAATLALGVAAATIFAGSIVAFRRRDLRTT